MKPGAAWRLNSPTLGIMSKDNRRVAVTVPANCVVRIVRDKNDRFIDVLWEGCELTLFAADLLYSTRAWEKAGSETSKPWIFKTYK